MIIVTAVTTAAAGLLVAASVAVSRRQRRSAPHAPHRVDTARHHDAKSSARMSDVDI